MFKNMNVSQIYVLSSLMGQDRYGLEIIQVVKEQSNYKILLGSLYNILNKLEREEFVTSYWSSGTVERGGHKRRYYKITGSGEMALRMLQGGLSSMWNINFS